MNHWKIENTALSDLDLACQLFDEAIAYQKRKGYPEYVWNDREAQAELIKAGYHYKVCFNQEIAAIFNLQESDKKIWGDLDQGTSFYLHRVVVNSKFKGQRLFGRILDWVIDFAKKNGKTTLRLDTWDNNPDLISYYEGFNFQKLSSFQIPNDPDVPLNCRGNKVVLMEYAINN